MVKRKKKKTNKINYGVNHVPDTNLDSRDKKKQGFHIEGFTLKVEGETDNIKMNKDKVISN